MLFLSNSIKGKPSRHISNVSTRTVLPPYTETPSVEWWMGAPEEVLPNQDGDPEMNGAEHSTHLHAGVDLPPQYRPPSADLTRYPSTYKPPTRSETLDTISSDLSYADPSPPATPPASVHPLQSIPESSGPSLYSEDAFHEFVGKKTSLKMKALGAFKLGSKKNASSNGVPIQEELPLTEAEAEMYAGEKMDNFRWLSTLAGRYADCRPLTEKDLVDPKVEVKISEIGKFSELVYSSIFIDSLIKHNKLLEKEGALTEYLGLLSDCVLVRQIAGPKTDLAAFVVYQRTARRVVVSIAGSSKVKHTVQNLRATRTPWHGTVAPSSGKEPGVAPREHPATSTKDGPAVHSGFLALYRDIKMELEQGVLAGMSSYPCDELVLTGHSMGGSIAYLFCLDLLSGESLIPLPKRMCLTTFGMPRTGNTALVQHFRGLLSQYEGIFEEYSVKVFNDGVPAVPLRSMGYAHFCERPMYTFRKKLYWVPEGHSESSLFRVQTQAGDSTDPWQNTFPRGGHNYYNGRDLEALRRISDTLLAAGFPDKLTIGWQDGVKGGSVKSRG